MGLGVYILVNGKHDEKADKLTQMVSSVEVNEQIDQATTYKINFAIDICDKDIATSLQAVTDPYAVLGILVTVKENLVCLVNGPVTKQMANLKHGGAGSSLQVEGSDHFHDLGKKAEGHQPWANTSDSKIVSSILSKKGLNADVADTGLEAHIETDHSLSQIESYAELIRQLAARNAYHFWLTYDEKGNGTGHFKPRNLKEENPMKKLIVNLENNNIDNLNIQWDINKPTKVHIQNISLRSKAISELDLTLEGEVTLGEVSLLDLVKDKGTIMQLTVTCDTEEDMRKRGKAALMEAHWFINATCQTSLPQLCDILRIHTIVFVDGAGKRHSGKYYVTGVKHTIDAANHKMEMSLARNGWGKEGDDVENLLAKIF
jgi:hypothetical protein